LPFSEVYSIVRCGAPYGVSRKELRPFDVGLKGHGNAVASRPLQIFREIRPEGARILASRRHFVVKLTLGGAALARHAPAPVAAASLPAPAVVLIGSVASIAAFAGVVTVAYGHAVDWTAVALFVALGMTAERFDVDLYADSRISISGLFLVTAAMLAGPSGVAIVAPAIALAGHVGRGRPLAKLIFNAGQFTLTGIASALTFALVVNVAGDAAPARAGGAIAAAAADFAMSSVLVSFIIAVTGGVTVSAVWREKFLWLAPHYLALGFLAFVLAVAYNELGPTGVLGFVGPAFLMRLAMKQYVDRTESTVTELREKHAQVQALSDELSHAYNETLAALAGALDLRDTETHGHSERVTELALALGEMLGIERGSREWLDLKHGAMLHDVGKVGVPDAILRKPTPLVDDEWAIIRQHPMHGYQMLRTVHFLAGAAELVLCHHERYDGKGYPRGLRGDEIPLGARIFAVADTFDAITSVRPYKPAYPPEAACEEIVRHSGTQFDPRVVQALLQLKGWGGRSERAA